MGVSVNRTSKRRLNRYDGQPGPGGETLQTLLKAEEYAREIAKEKLGTKTPSIKRFGTGLTHFVFDVKEGNAFRCVIRIARPERATELERGIYWHRRMESIGIRLPQIFQIGEIDDHPYAVYERLRGDDLEIIELFQPRHWILHLHRHTQPQ